MATQHQVVVVDPRFCFPQQTILIMQEQLGMFRNDSFSITDSTGRPFFVLAAAPSLSSNRTLLDIYQAPVLQMQRKMPSLRGVWLMNRAADGARVASIRPAMGFSPTIKVFLNDGDEEADFLVEGNLRAKKFDVLHVVRGQRRVVAHVSKESKFANSTAFLMSMVAPASSKYMVTIEPGVDAAFIIALATLVDEVFNDQGHD